MHEVHTLKLPSLKIDSYFGTKISGGYYMSGEGPFIEYNPDNGYYYLWVTYGELLSDAAIICVFFVPKARQVLFMMRQEKRQF